MSTTYTAYSYDISESSIQITKATVAKDRVIIEWTEGGYSGGLTATSSDGAVYEGTFSYLGWPNEIYHARLGRFSSSNGVILLFGEWWEVGSTQRETWLLQLVPTKAE